MNGDSFLRVPFDGSWVSRRLLWNSPKEQARLASSTPFQVFSCWNGAVAIAAGPLLQKLIKFRGPGLGECYQGEPQLFCKDMWYLGYGRIAVVPSVNLAYDDVIGTRIKAIKGYVSELIHNEDGNHKISWDKEPPGKTKCMPGLSRHRWVDWNEGLDILAPLSRDLK